MSDQEIAAIVGGVIAAVLYAIWLRDQLARRRKRARVAIVPRVPLDPRTLFDGHVQRIGSLHLPSGNIVACDPLVFPETAPFERQVDAGDYPVDIAVLGRCIAAVRVTFQPGKPVRFDRAGDYGVDAGLGCFMDARTAPLLEQAITTDEHVDALIEALGDRGWTDHRPSPDRADNVMIVASGLGDGIYTSYWGLDEHDVPMCLVTDFNVRRRDVVS